MRRRIFPLLPLALTACARAPSGSIAIAAASSLMQAFQEIGNQFTAESGIDVVFNFGATAQLAHQISNAAPFDVFAAADLQHIESLIQSGKLARDGSGVFGRGKLAMWAPKRPNIRTLVDLLRDDVRFVAIARPASAPYGAAAIEALQSAGIWQRVQPKVVYANNINMARQYAASGNAEVALTAWSLVLHEATATLVDASLYKPIEQAIGVVTASRQREHAARFVGFVLGDKGKAVLARFGYTN